MSLDLSSVKSENFRVGGIQKKQNQMITILTFLSPLTTFQWKGQLQLIPNLTGWNVFDWQMCNNMLCTRIPLTFMASVMSLTTVARGASFFMYSCIRWFCRARLIIYNRSFYTYNNCNSTKNTYTMAAIGHKFRCYMYDLSGQRLAMGQRQRCLNRRGRGMGSWHPHPSKVNINISKWFWISCMSSLSHYPQLCEWSKMAGLELGTISLFQCSYPY